MYKSRKEDPCSAVKKYNVYRTTLHLHCQATVQLNYFHQELWLVETMKMSSSNWMYRNGQCYRKAEFSKTRLSIQSQHTCRSRILSCLSSTVPLRSSLVNFRILDISALTPDDDIFSHIFRCFSNCGGCVTELPIVNNKNNNTRNLTLSSLFCSLFLVLS